VVGMGGPMTNTAQEKDLWISAHVALQSREHGAQGPGGIFFAPPSKVDFEPGDIGTAGGTEHKGGARWPFAEIGEN